MSVPTLTCTYTYSYKPTNYPYSVAVKAYHAIYMYLPGNLVKGSTWRIVPVMVVHLICKISLRQYSWTLLHYPVKDMGRPCNCLVTDPSPTVSSD